MIASIPGWWPGIVGVLVFFLVLALLVLTAMHGEVETPDATWRARPETSRLRVTRQTKTKAELP